MVFLNPDSSVIQCLIRDLDFTLLFLPNLISSKDGYELANCGNPGTQEAETSGHLQVLDSEMMYTGSSRPARATQDSVSKQSKIV